MLGFVDAHLVDDRTRCQVAGGQAFEVTFEVMFDLALGLDDEV